MTKKNVKANLETSVDASVEAEVAPQRTNEGRQAVQPNMTTLDVPRPLSAGIEIQELATAVSDVLLQSDRGQVERIAEDLRRELSFTNEKLDQILGRLEEADMKRSQVAAQTLEAVDGIRNTTK